MNRSICLFNSNRAWGGGEQWFLTHALLLAERGWRVCAVTHSSSVLGDRLSAHSHINLLRIPVGNLSFLNPAVLSRLVAFFRKNAVQSVILALPSDLKCGGIAARLAGVGDVIFRRGLALPTRDSLLNRFLFRRVLTKLLCNSEHTRRMVLSANTNLMAPSRTFVVYNGIDLPAFDALPGHPLVLRSHGSVVIGCAGRLTEQKGHQYLIDATALLRQRGLDVTVLLAGTGELEQELRARVASLGLEDCFRFLGFVEEMKQFYASIDIFALPSLWEGFGYVLSEAMSMRLPVVAFEASNIPEVVEHGGAGLLVPPRDVVAFADALEKLAQDPALRVRMGQNGRQRVESQFTLAKTFHALEKVLLA
ncbi:MAG: glycosyltransferase family 4 protein [Desulfomicrobium sp.]|nr:glycosyltransferase family 4 protein [Pseudomonadota bacterium]MBV1713534.1 glycosyltransferase family 4 protein [Desulfomicrobium sp.]MBU4572070.1 glycosyltransferase family 4 protein [Pseudomonadota bacterium]MBU4594048.1 glycosyltransferase family 4 protein [Pseudomonadota bacterium]MBV1721001.1 glycosyltransferase family 4 protein [Desulfomicrobium sp.]